MSVESRARPRRAGTGQRSTTARRAQSARRHPKAASQTRASRRAATAALPAAVANSTIPARFFRQLVVSMRNGVVVITRDGRLAALNAEACRIFGLRPTRATIGRPVATVLKAYPEVVDVLLGAFEQAHGPDRVELRLRDSNKFIGYTLSLVRDDQGRETGAALFFKDLTRVEQLEERERLRDRLAALGEMAAAMAHEVKNPLAGIEVMAGLLRRLVPDSSDAQALLSDIIREAKTANAIMLEALDFVRPLRVQFEDTEVRSVLKSAAVAAQRKFPDHAVKVKLNVPKSLPPIEADSHLLVQMFSNLLINAFEATGTKGTVTVTARQQTSGDDRLHPAPEQPLRTVVVDVSDTGPGIPPELHDRIFNAFFTTKPQGSGLGLSIVHRIVGTHNGIIDLARTNERGTTFRVTLPISMLRPQSSVLGEENHGSHSDS